MKIRNPVGAVLLACAALAITSSPASANHTEGCVGQGTMLTSPLYYPLVGPDGGGGGFSMHTPAAFTICTGPHAALWADGSFGLTLAYCEHWAGTGTINGHSAMFEFHGSLLIVAGTPALNGNVIAGVFLVAPDVLNGQSCIDGATRFIVTGYVNFVA